MKRSVIKKKLAAVIAALGLVGGTIPAPVAYAAEEKDVPVPTSGREAYEWIQSGKITSVESLSQAYSKGYIDSDRTQILQLQLTWKNAGSQPETRTTDGITIDSNGHCSIPAGRSQITARSFQNPQVRAALKSVSLPSSMISVGVQIFKNCYNLSKVELNEGLRYIGAEAFIGCEALSKISIPSTVQEIMSKAFADTGIISPDQVSGLTLWQLKKLGEYSGKVSNPTTAFPAFTFAEESVEPATVKWAVIAYDISDQHLKGSVELSKDQKPSFADMAKAVPEIAKYEDYATIDVDNDKGIIELHFQCSPTVKFIDSETDKEICDPIKYEATPYTAQSQAEYYGNEVMGKYGYDKIAKSSTVSECKEYRIVLYRAPVKWTIYENNIWCLDTVELARGVVPVAGEHYTVPKYDGYTPTITVDKEKNTVNITYEKESGQEPELPSVFFDCWQMVSTNCYMFTPTGIAVKTGSIPSVPEIINAAEIPEGYRIAKGGISIDGSRWVVDLTLEPVPPANFDPSSDSAYDIWTMKSTSTPAYEPTTQVVKAGEHPTIIIPEKYIFSGCSVDEENKEIDLDLILAGTKPSRPWVIVSRNCLGYRTEILGVKDGETPTLKQIFDAYDMSPAPENYELERGEWAVQVFEDEKIVNVLLSRNAWASSDPLTPPPANPDSEFPAVPNQGSGNSAVAESELPKDDGTNQERNELTTNPLAGREDGADSTSSSDKPSATNSASEDELPASDTPYAAEKEEDEDGEDKGSNENKKTQTMELPATGDELPLAAILGSMTAALAMAVSRRNIGIYRR